MALGFPGHMAGLGSSPLRMMGGAGSPSAQSGSWFARNGLGSNFSDFAQGIRGITSNFAAGFGRSPEVRERAAYTAAGIEQQQADSRRQILEWTFGNLETLAQGIQGIGTIPPGLQAFFDKSYSNLEALGLDPSVIEETKAYVEALAQTPVADEAFTLSPGQTRFQGGQEVASLPPDPTAVTSSNVVGAILQKIANGEQITAGEQQALAKYESLSRSANSMGLTLSVTPEGFSVGGGAGGGSLSSGAGGGVGGVPVGTLPAGQAQSNFERLRALESGIQDIDRLISIAEQPGGQLGFTGAVKGTVKEAGRVAGEASEELPVVGQTIQTLTDMATSFIQMDPNIDADASAELLSGDPQIDARAIENRLAYFLARSRKPDEKINKEDVLLAREEVNLFGAQSEQKVLGNLKVLRQGMVQAHENLSRSSPGIGGGGGELQPETQVESKPEGNTVTFEGKTYNVIDKLSGGRMVVEDPTSKQQFIYVP